MLYVLVSLLEDILKDDYSKYTTEITKEILNQNKISQIDFSLSRFFDEKTIPKIKKKLYFKLVKAIEQDKFEISNEHIEGYLVDILAHPTQKFVLDTHFHPKTPSEAYRQFSNSSVYRIIVSMLKSGFLVRHSLIPQSHTSSKYIYQNISIFEELHIIHNKNKTQIFCKLNKKLPESIEITNVLIPDKIRIPHKV